MCLAIPGRVDAIFEDGLSRMGKVNFGGIVKDVCLAYLPDIAVGDYTIVHVGFAISKIDEASAQQTLQTFREMGLLEEELSASEASNAAPDKEGQS
jgi:hydrogenase expression/formation protein HypC